MAEQYANNAATTLNGALTNVTTTVVVTSATGFPSTAPFRIIVDSEIMTVTAGAGSTSWTVTRGAEGTSAVSHLTAAAVTHVVTSGSLVALIDRAISSGTLANRPASGDKGALYQATDIGITYIYDGAAWQSLTAMIDSRTAFMMQDDFISGTTSNGGIGAFDWSSLSGTTTRQAAVANHPGIIQRSTGTTINTVAALYLATSTNTGSIKQSDFFDFTFYVRLNTNDTSTIVNLGLTTDIAAASPTTGAYIEKAAADTSWFGKCANTGSTTRTAALATITTGWVRLRARRVDASNIGFSVDGGTELTVSTNIPSFDLFPFITISNTAAAAKTIDIDAITFNFYQLGR